MKAIIPRKEEKTEETPNFTVFDCTVVVLSMLSIVVDLCTDLILIMEYLNQGHKSWAISTFVLIFFPSIIVQTFSLRWHVINKTADLLHWVLHICMLGLIHRYIKVFETGLEARKTKESSDYQKLYSEQSDLCILHLFESFLESAPQLVLQLYIIVTLHEWRFWTGLSAGASLVSLAWALAAYTKAQRQARPDKKSASLTGLLLQALWRIGMLSARISALVLFAYCFGSWIFLFIGLHWLAMTFWIVRQQTDLCDTHWEERIYNAVAGVIYCFCFFNLQEGKSRWRALSFYSVVTLENMTCLTVFLMWFAGKTPKLAVIGFVAVVGGTLLGVVSMVLYYRFFHPTGPIKLCWTTTDDSENAQSHDGSLTTCSNTGTLRSLKHMRQAAESTVSKENSLQSDTKQLLNNVPIPLSDSIVIIEENVMADTDVDIKILQSWIHEENNASHQSETSTNVDKILKKESDLDNDAYKRRAICSSVDLVKLIEYKEKEEEVESNGSLKLVGTDEAPSEILSAHDYENLCAVNIARETWGLRSWRGYSDIETWLHDDSIVHDRRRDTMTSTTTSSERSSNILQKENERTRQDDYLDTIADDLAQCESETSSDAGFTGQFSLDSLGAMGPMSTLDTILEELEESSTSTNLTEVKLRKVGAASSLVATIDEIRLNTPVQNRYVPFVRPWNDFHSSVNDVALPAAKTELTPEEILFLSKLRTVPEPTPQTPVEVEKDKKSPKKDDVIIKKPFTSEKTEPPKKASKKPRRKFSVIRERFESKRTESTTDLFTSNERLNATPYEQNKKLNVEVTDKENIPTVASKISHWNKILNHPTVKKTPEKLKVVSPSKRVSVKEKRNFFLKQVLTPPKFQSLRKKSFKINPSS